MQHHHGTLQRKVIHSSVLQPAMDPNSVTGITDNDSQVPQAHSDKENASPKKVDTNDPEAVIAKVLASSAYIEQRTFAENVVLGPATSITPPLDSQTDQDACDNAAKSRTLILGNPSDYMSNASLLANKLLTRAGKTVGAATDDIPATLQPSGNADTTPQDIVTQTTGLTGNDSSEEQAPNILDFLSNMASEAGKEVETCGSSTPTVNPIVPETPSPIYPQVQPSDVVPQDDHMPVASPIISFDYSIDNLIHGGNDDVLEESGNDTIPISTHDISSTNSHVTTSTVSSMANSDSLSTVPSHSSSQCSTPVGQTSVISTNTNILSSSLSDHNTSDTHSSTSMVQVSQPAGSPKHNEYTNAVQANQLQLALDQQVAKQQPHIQQLDESQNHLSDDHSQHLEMSLQGHESQQQQREHQSIQHQQIQQQTYLPEVIHSQQYHHPQQHHHPQQSQRASPLQPTMPNHQSHQYLAQQQQQQQQPQPQQRQSSPNYLPDLTLQDFLGDTSFMLNASVQQSSTTTGHSLFNLASLSNVSTEPTLHGGLHSGTGLHENQQTMTSVSQPCEPTHSHYYGQAHTSTTERSQQQSNSYPWQTMSWQGPQGIGMQGREAYGQFHTFNVKPQKEHFTAHSPSSMPPNVSLHPSYNSQPIHMTQPEQFNTVTSMPNSLTPPSMSPRENIAFEHYASAYQLPRQQSPILQQRQTAAPEHGIPLASFARHAQKELPRSQFNTMRPPLHPSQTTSNTYRPSSAHSDPNRVSYRPRLPSSSSLPSRLQLPRQPGSMQHPSNQKLTSHMAQINNHHMHGPQPPQRVQIPQVASNQRFSGHPRIPLHQRSYAPPQTVKQMPIPRPAHRPPPPGYTQAGVPRLSSTHASHLPQSSNRQISSASATTSTSSATASATASRRLSTTSEEASSKAAISKTSEGDGSSTALAALIVESMLKNKQTAHVEEQIRLVNDLLKGGSASKSPPSPPRTAAPATSPRVTVSPRTTGKDNSPRPTHAVNAATSRPPPKQIPDGSSRPTITPQAMPQQKKKRNNAPIYVDLTDDAPVMPSVPTPSTRDAPLSVEKPACTSSGESGKRPKQNVDIHIFIEVVNVQCPVAQYCLMERCLWGICKPKHLARCKQTHGWWVYQSENRQPGPRHDDVAYVAAQIIARSQHDKTYFRHEMTSILNSEKGMRNRIFLEVGTEKVHILGRSFMRDKQGCGLLFMNALNDLPPAATPQEYLQMTASSNMTNALRQLTAERRASKSSTKGTSSGSTTTEGSATQNVLSGEPQVLVIAPLADSVAQEVLSEPDRPVRGGERPLSEQERYNIEHMAPIVIQPPPTPAPPQVHEDDEEEVSPLVISPMGPPSTPMRPKPPLPTPPQEQRPPMMSGLLDQTPLVIAPPPTPRPPSPPPDVGPEPRHWHRPSMPPPVRMVAPAFSTLQQALDSVLPVTLKPAAVPVHTAHLPQEQFFGNSAHPFQQQTPQQFNNQPLMQQLQLQQLNTNSLQVQHMQQQLQNQQMQQQQNMAMLLQLQGMHSPPPFLHPGMPQLMPNIPTQQLMMPPDHTLTVQRPVQILPANPVPITISQNVAEILQPLLPSPTVGLHISAQSVNDLSRTTLGGKLNKNLKEVGNEWPSSFFPLEELMKIATEQPARSMSDGPEHRVQEYLKSILPNENYENDVTLKHLSIKLNRIEDEYKSLGLRKLARHHGRRYKIKPTSILSKPKRSTARRTFGIDDEPSGNADDEDADPVWEAPIEDEFDVEPLEQYSSDSFASFTDEYSEIEDNSDRELKKYVRRKKIKQILDSSSDEEEVGCYDVWDGNTNESPIKQKLGEKIPLIKKTPSKNKRIIGSDDEPAEIVPHIIADPIFPPSPSASESLPSLLSPSPSLLSVELSQSVRNLRKICPSLQPVVYLQRLTKGQIRIHTQKTLTSKAQSSPMPSTSRKKGKKRSREGGSSEEMSHGVKSKLSKRTDLPGVDTASKHQCVQDPLEFNTNDRLWTEIVKRQNITSCVCGISFIDQKLYNLHRDLHDIDNPRKCAICSDVFDDWMEFTSHTFYTHKSPLDPL